MLLRYPDPARLRLTRLHPTIGAHASLLFDIFDTWNERAVGGCTYHVSYPGGRGYEQFPVNANEAEARRVARFMRQGHTAGEMTVRPEAPSREFPLILDHAASAGLRCGFRCRTSAGAAATATVSAPRESA